MGVPRKENGKYVQGKPVRSPWVRKFYALVAVIAVIVALVFLNDFMNGWSAAIEAGKKAKYPLMYKSINDLTCEEGMIVYEQCSQRYAAYSAIDSCRGGYIPIIIKCYGANAVAKKNR